MEELQRRLNTFPLREEDTFERLQSLVVGKIKNEKLKHNEQNRLEQELSVIRETNTAFIDLISNIPKTGHRSVYTVIENKNRGVYE